MSYHCVTYKINYQVNLKINYAAAVLFHHCLDN